MIKDYLYKEVPTPIAIGIILVLVVLVGGYTWWQYSEIRKEETELPKIEIPEKEVFSCKNNSDCIYGWPEKCIMNCVSRDTPKKIPCPLIKPALWSSYIWENISCKCVDNKCIEDKEAFCQKACEDWVNNNCIEGISKSAFLAKKCKDEISCECLENETADLSSEALATEDWKIYKNEEYRFEFKYPKTWNISEKYADLVEVINITKPLEKIIILKSSGPPPETMDMEIIESKAVTVDNITVTRELMQGRFEHNKDQYYLRVFIFEKSIFYHADFSKDNFKEFSLIYDQILSTFRFLN